MRSARRPVALCLEPHDLVLAKCAAGRDRDWEFAEEALRAGLVQAEVLMARADDLPLASDDLAHVESMLQAIVKRTRSH